MNDPGAFTVPADHVAYEYGSGVKYHCECQWCEPRMVGHIPHPSKNVMGPYEDDSEGEAMAIIDEILKRSGL